MSEGIEKCKDLLLEEFRTSPDHTVSTDPIEDPGKSLLILNMMAEGIVQIIPGGGPP